MLDSAQIILIHARRKSISYKVVGENQLEVRAPLQASKADVLNCLSRYEEKIKRMMAHYAKVHSPRSYAQGSTILFMGKALTIKYVPGASYTWRLEDCLYINQEYRDLVPEVLRDFYTAQAKRLVFRARILAKQHGFPWTKISTRWCRSRWGSCSSAGNISLNNALIMAAVEVMDYVIIHEYCHLQHHNHSADFWHSVKQILPDYRQQYAWLKENGHLLRIQADIDVEGKGFGCQ
ncbi:MAG: SprT family zinc-dependent metalloprotease [Candidatus Cloacimonetes bacterium]|nr:SprT family zinc-dependent metalloprotease [Candidatus Cloacimonadota bacterium]